jgi:hypothetical protein
VSGPGHVVVEGEVADEDPEVKPLLLSVVGYGGWDSLHPGVGDAGSGGPGIAGAGADPDLPPVTVGVGIGSDGASLGTGCPREMEVGGKWGLEGELSWAGLILWRTGPPWSYSCDW